MNPADEADRVADAHGEYQRRAERGDTPSPAEYAERLGDAFPGFVAAVEAEALLARVLDPRPDPPLPREFGPYTLLRELGRGGGGVVYEALHRELRRLEALKVLPPALAEDSEGASRFRREAEACARVRHPNIASLYAVGRVDERPYYSMELIEGTTLRRLPPGTARAEPRALARGFAGVAEALEATHRAGVLHRDVKPSNVMLAKDGRMVLTDFGLARISARSVITQADRIVGTPTYMSPEQMLGRPGEVDARTDVYSLGATMYEVLAGRPPFDADSVEALAQQVLHDRPPPLRRVAPHLSADFEHVVMKAMEKRPADRYPTAAALAADLRALAEGRPVLGRPLSPWRRTGRWLARRAAVIAAVGFAAVGGWSWLSHRPARLRITTCPAATVFVGDRRVGVGDVEVDQPPGPFVVRAEREEFVTVSRPLEARAGGDQAVDLLLVPKDLTRRRLVDLTVECTSGRRAPLLPSPPRGADEEAASLLLPRGALRPSELLEWRLETSPRSPADDALFARGATVVFTRRGETLHRARIPAVPRELRGALPADLRAALAPGDVVEWSLVLADDTRRTARFEVVDETSPDQRRLARLRERLDAARVPAGVRAYVLGPAYLRQRMVLAAIAVGEAGVRAAASPGESAASLAVLAEAVVTVDLSGTRYGADAFLALDDLPEAVRAEWFPPASSDGGR